MNDKVIKAPVKRKGQHIKTLGQWVILGDYKGQEITKILLKKRWGDTTITTHLIFQENDMDSAGIEVPEKIDSLVRILISKEL